MTTPTRRMTAADLRAEMALWGRDASAWRRLGNHHLANRAALYARLYMLRLLRVNNGQT